MRPKKIILCLSSSEGRLSERAFLLSTLGYEVLRARTIAAAQKHLSGKKNIRLILVDLPVPFWSDGAIVDDARRVHRNLRTVVISNTPGYQDSLADAYLPQGSDSPTEILLRIKLLIQWQRGPKKTVEGDGTVIMALSPLARTLEYAA
jgi:response regulator RpfG family c-di-GMP phosphodiesterase